MENSQAIRQSFESPIIGIKHAIPYLVQSAGSWLEKLDEEAQPVKQKVPYMLTINNEQDLMRRLALLHFMLDASPQGIMLTDLEGNLILRNSVFLRLFDLSDIDVDEWGKQWIDSIGQQVKNSERMLRFLRLILEGKRGETLDVFEMNNGRVLECRTSCQMVDQLYESFRLWSFQDCTEQYRRESELQHLSMHDPLTGVYNRAFFEMKLLMFRRSGLYPVAMIMLDVDGLKNVNDHRGHLAGDELLCQVARILRQACRKDDVFARLGGDEFGLLLAQTDLYTADQVVGRIQGLLNLHNIRRPETPISLSMGCAVANSDAEMEYLVLHADEIMYTERRKRRAIK